MPFTTFLREYITQTHNPVYLTCPAFSSWFEESSFTTIHSIITEFAFCLIGQLCPIAVCSTWTRYRCTRHHRAVRSSWTGASSAQGTITYIKMNGAMVYHCHARMITFSNSGLFYLLYLYYYL